MGASLSYPLHPLLFSDSPRSLTGGKFEFEFESDYNSAMFQHLHGCKAFKFLLSLNNLPECINNKADVINFKSYVHQTILNNVTIIACNNNYNQLCFLESLLIKRYKPQLTYGIKAAKELVLF